MHVDPSPPKRLIIVTVAFFVVLIGAALFTLKPKLPDPVAINTKGQPTIGYAKSPVHIVIFEEPKCSNCSRFNTQIYPKLKQEFIDTHQATYTVIPVSFLPGSMPAAIALLCVYYSDPLYPNAELYFAYLDYLYAHQPDEKTDWATPTLLREYAIQVSPAIHPDSLMHCVSTQAFRVKIQQNTDYAQRIMGGEIATPTMYVNGIEVKELDYDHIKSLIQSLIERGGQ